MDGKLVWVAVLAMVIAFGCRREAAPEATLAVDQWLEQNCTAGEGTQLEETLEKYGSMVEQPLLDAFEKGPPEEKVRPAEEAARTRLRSVQALVRAGAGRETFNARQQAMLDIRVEDHAAENRRSFLKSYREAALTGLAVIGSSKGRQLIEREAADPRSPFRELAQELLQDR